MIKRLSLLICLLLNVVLYAQPRIFIIGDSTTEWYGQWWYPRTGWGGVFQFFFDNDKFVVDNRAVGGTTTKSFYNTYWTDVIADINEGDYLFISFGANDFNPVATYHTTLDEFIDYVGIFCNATRDKGATPILLTTINQNLWNSKGIPLESYYNYPQAMKKASEKYNTPFFDIYNFGLNLSKEVGCEYNTFYRYNSYKPGEYENYPEGNEDDVHIQETGAIDISRYIVEEIEKSTDERLKPLAEATKKRFNVTFDTDDDTQMSSISRSATFPEGINVTLKSYGADSTKRCHWINENGDVISNNHVYIYVMKDRDEHFTAIYNTSSAKQISSDNFRVLSDRIIFSDDLIHTVCVYTLSGYEITSVSTQSNYEFNLPSGICVLTIDRNKSTKIVIK